MKKITYHQRTQPKNSNALLNTLLKAIIFPLKGFLMLFIAPFVLPWKFGKRLYETVKYAKGRPGQEVNSFDIWYHKNNMTEAQLTSVYKSHSYGALLSLISLLVFMFVFVYLLIIGIPLLRASFSFLGMMLSFGMYFHHVVFAYCFKTRSYDYKADAFKSLDDLIPNPYLDFAAASVEVNGDIKKVDTSFYPKGKKILKD